MEREVKGLDLLENAIEYVREDVDSRSGFMQELEEFQTRLIEYRSVVYERITEQNTS